ncbi:AraC family transcriptional regulator [Sphingomonas canadensis]|uniref:AraC family transcriptional regulator n=1 Tax=Sphingomonas canadensis TaxID=1219257 RepID=A0ABW3H452_9SPHN|nr:AraC family transcriptional regulator [Sphingomonas canadensis]MCW3835524.1 AraC family transcriptional regulator [Sphingomonas canadensis]
MDPLSDLIALLRPHTALSKAITGRGTWGVRYAAQDVPGFALVIEGGCWLTLAGQAPVRLAAGDFVLLPSTPAFEMASSPGAACVPGVPAGLPVRHGDPAGDPDFRMLGGSFEIDRVNAPLLLALLPAMIHVRAGERDTGRLSRIAALILDECDADRPGGDMILGRLLEVLLVEALREQPVAGGGAVAGLLAGMRDPALARALGAIHAEVRASWTVAGLARVAGMSRSAFAARFGTAMGCAPIEYLARWRMALARHALSLGGKTLDRIAEEIGYESASAFSTAFRRRMGCSPGAFARSPAAAVP